ncbi:integrating conjugative element protein [Burkholderia pseudomallei]|uniref:integrating conjugative element protein n=1 Tax=Burkholderia pseudomallei TaxID=28450 RepID=UPI0021F725BE|nr:integrating conjugative element protein [Burkholderia pseudomallei]MCW0111768.1 integrating conjugative element protein [Burkholderia pseudomallei]
MKHFLARVAVAMAPSLAAAQGLIVVADDGGTSALPYYQALNLLPDTPSPIEAITPSTPYREADLLPVHSSRLTPGHVTARTISAPGLSPFFLIGDDLPSRAWLHARGDALRALGAVGMVVNVNAADGLAALRRDAPGLMLVPTSGDDIAQRLAGC